MRLPLEIVLALLPERPSEARAEAARLADARARRFEAEARRAQADGLTGIAGAFAERAREHRVEALRLLGAGS